jgi:hypothetical protein
LIAVSIVVAILILLWIGVMGLFCAAQFAATAAHLRWFRRYATPDLADADCPRAAVVLCLRGADPFLQECLERLGKQDYPRYEIWIVLDSPSDPAERVVRAWMASCAAKATLTCVEQISQQTSLKVNALRHAFSQLGEEIEVVALIDADTLPHSTWLRQLVAPLVGGGVGVVSGNRWYSPALSTWGSLIRFVYNGFSLIPMQMIGAIWPGSLSLHRKVFADPGLLERMRSASCEDEAILEAMRRAGLTLTYTPDCTMLNCEECSLRSCFRFVQRQLLWTRLCNPNWKAVLAGTLASCATIAAGVLLAIVALVRGEFGFAAGAGAALVGLELFQLAVIEWLHRVVSARIERLQGFAAVRITALVRLRLAVALAAALPLYVSAAISATFARRVRWRGITYRVRPPNAILMLGYAPYVEDAGAASAKHSL